MKNQSGDVNNLSHDYLAEIESEQALRKIISGYPKMLDKRIQRALDPFSIEFIEVSKVAVLATASKHNVMFVLQCKPDKLGIVDDQHFAVNKVSESNLSPGDAYPLQASLFFMVPGIGHALRINGCLKPSKNEAYIFTITQAYFHCARAVARSDFWTPKARPSSNLEIDNVVSRSSYLLLKTLNADGQTEISPRGDEAGFVKQLSPTTLLIPERPGNKIAVSLRNIISCPELELLFMVPGENHTMNVKGLAKVISDREILEQCAVKGKIPKTGILVNVQSSQFQLDPVLESENIWDTRSAISKHSITAFPKALSAHINGTGMLGKATATIVGAVVKHDMKNLY